jgi:membrane protease YdiL (CAAX protease family)
MSLLRGPGRGRAFFRFLLGVAWIAIAYYLSRIAARGFSRDAAFPLIRNLFAIFMLIVGFGYMEMAWDRKPEPLRAMGLARRPGDVREFAMGAALGWGMVTVVILVSALAGTFYVQLWASFHAWQLLVLQMLALAAGALAGEIAFRGYPFQKLIETTGPFTATILSGIFFGVLCWKVPGTTPTAVWASALAAVVLSVAYLRTHALWLSWGLHFAWVASIAVLFGQPLAGSRQASSVIHTYVDGPTWLTGGEYGPEASMVTLVVLWAGLYILIWMTRDLAWKYSQPELKPAGIPVDLSHPMHPAPPPPAASAPAQNTPTTGLVQIAPLSMATSPAPQNSTDEASSIPLSRSSNSDVKRQP